MGKNNIKIDGEKLRSLLESASGKSIYQVALGCGYSRNLIAESIRVGVASPIVQNVAKLYGIEPSAYELKTPVVAPTSPESVEKDNQLSIYDLSQEALNEAVKKALEASLPDMLKATFDKVLKDAYEQGRKDGYNKGVNARFPNNRLFDI